MSDQDFDDTAFAEDGFEEFDAADAADAEAQAVAGENFSGGQDDFAPPAQDFMAVGGEQPAASQDFLADQSAPAQGFMSDDSAPAQDFMAVGGDQAAPAQDFMGGAAAPSETKGDEEVDPRAEWRREYQARLEAKRAASRQAIQGRKEAAAKAISEYYEMKETTREAKLSAGRTSEQTVFARLDEIDINQDDPEAHTTEVSRFKNVLVRLKNDPLPAAAAE